MSKTIIIQIGNSDDRLSQIEWSEFVNEVQQAVEIFANEIHFFGASSNWMRWQNAAWILSCDESNIRGFKHDMSKLGKQFKQDSIAWSESETEFI